MLLVFLDLFQKAQQNYKIQKCLVIDTKVTALILNAHTYDDFLIVLFKCTNLMKMANFTENFSW